MCSQLYSSDNQSLSTAPADRTNMHRTRQGALYNSTRMEFVCPCCDCVSLTPLRVGSDTITTVCRTCRTRQVVSVPATSKKIIYLDQWFISDLVESASTEGRKLLNLLQTLVERQMITVVLSDLNVRETAAGLLGEKVRARYNEFFKLSNGNITGVHKNPVDSQLLSAAMGQHHSFHWADCFESSPHQWQLFNRDVSVIPYGLLNFEQYFSDNPRLNQQVMDLLDTQLAELPLAATFEDVYRYTKQQYLTELRDAACYARKLSSYTNSTDQEKDAFQIHLARTYTHHPERLPLLTGFMPTCSFDSLPLQLRISAAFDAVRLHAASEARRNTGDYGRGKKFNVKYGASALNDASHLAKYSPYVDCMLVDTNTDKLIRNQTALSELFSEIDCKLFDPSTVDNFASELKALLLQPRTIEHELTCKLCLRGSHLE